MFPKFISEFNNKKVTIFEENKIEGSKIGVQCIWNLNGGFLSRSSFFIFFLIEPFPVLVDFGPDENSSEKAGWIRFPILGFCDLCPVIAPDWNPAPSDLLE